VSHQVPTALWVTGLRTSYILCNMVGLLWGFLHPGLFGRCRSQVPKFLLVSLGQLATLYICLYKCSCTHVSGTGCVLLDCVRVLHTDVYVEGPAAVHLGSCIVQWGVSQSIIALPHSKCPLCHLHSPTDTMLYALRLCLLYQLWSCPALVVQWNYI
jgi:hypothetical protein